MQSQCPILERVTEAEKTEFSKDAWQIIRCKETGFVFLSDPPAYELLEEELAWEKTSAVEKERRTKQEPVWSRLSDFAKTIKMSLFPRRNKFFKLLCSMVQGAPSKPLTILDVGCGSGELLEDICDRFKGRNQKVVPWGIEISKNLAAIAEQKFQGLGGRVVSDSALGGANSLEPNSLDVIIMSSFLEHEAQPLGLLRQLKTALRPDGVVIVKVPNFGCWNRMLRGEKWCGFRYPDHVNYFTPKTLQMLASKAELPIARQKLTDKFPLSDNMYAVLKKAA
ncbi:MAG: hypothetical protein Aurels2KO_12620 [Aureliella sp.]